MSEKIIQTSPVSGNTIVNSGAWTIDTELGLLTDDGGGVKRLEPRLSRLMSLLIDNAGHFVSRAELTGKMWPDAVVTDQSLTRAVADLRKFLRANYQTPPVIETASKQGYRLTYPDRNETVARQTDRPSRDMLRLVAYGIGALMFLVLLVRALSY